MTNEDVNLESNEMDWLDKLERKSNSPRTRQCASTSLKIFDLFCESQGYSKSSNRPIQNLV
ncbi:MAG: hypothetical protein ACREAK_03770 [Nitrosarchaeum sp.]